MSRDYLGPDPDGEFRGPAGPGAPEYRDPAIKTENMPHQQSLYTARRDDPGFCLWWEMGLGKTKLLIDVASHHWFSGRITCLLVLAPRSVYRNWLGQEIPPHMAAPYVGMNYDTNTARRIKEEFRRDMFLSAGPADEFPERLRVVCVSYDSLLTAECQDFLTKLTLLHRTMIVADESSAISNGKALRTQVAKRIRANCEVAWTATGTPVAQSPNKCHSQVDFVDPRYWSSRGLRSYLAFKSRFGVFKRRQMGRKSIDQQVGHRDLDKLAAILRPISSRLLKEDSSVRLPPKTYTIREFEMTEEQGKLYESLADRFVAELDAAEADRESADGPETSLFVESQMAVVRLARLQQICCGYVTATSTARVSDETTRALLLELDETGEGDARGPLADHVLQESGIEMDERALARLDAEISRAAHEQRSIERSAEEASRQQTLPGVVTDFGDDAEETDEPGQATSATRAGPATPRRAAVNVRRDGLMTDLMPWRDNPRVQLLIGLLEECVPAHKVIVWTRYKRDVEQLVEAIGEAFGPDSVVRYDGSTKTRDREIALTRFRDPEDPCRVFLANTHAISQGVTLTIAKSMIYYSNSFSLERRLQSEDRFHRIGQNQPVQIIDIEAKLPGGKSTVDARIRKALREKFDISAQVTGDRARDWIRG